MIIAALMKKKRRKFREENKEKGEKGRRRVLRNLIKTNHNEKARNLKEY